MRHTVDVGSAGSQLVEWRVSALASARTSVIEGPATNRLKWGWSCDVSVTAPEEAVLHRT